MKKIILIIILFILFGLLIYAEEENIKKYSFWEDVEYGVGFSEGICLAETDAMIIFPPMFLLNAVVLSLNYSSKIYPNYFEGIYHGLRDQRIETGIGFGFTDWMKTVYIFSGHTLEKHTLIGLELNYMFYHISSSLFYDNNNHPSFGIGLYFRFNIIDLKYKRIRMNIYLMPKIGYMFNQSNPFAYISGIYGGISIRFGGKE